MMTGVIAAIFQLAFAASTVLASDSDRTKTATFSVQGDQILLDGESFKIIGLRCSNALISDEATDDLIEYLPVYCESGINAVSVFFMGSRFGDAKGFRPDATLDPVYADRMARIIKAADKQKMIVVVGGLYWSTSKAKEDLGHWKQEDANRAIANTVRWLSDHDYRNVFVDVDNEGMAHDATGWSIAELIDAGHAVDPTIMLAYNDSDPPPNNADLYIHHSPRVAGKPWLDTEATPGKSTPGGYWGSFSKETHTQTNGSYYNYSRIGRYTDAMKAEQMRRTVDEIDRYNGHMLASTWLQCVPNEGVRGPFTKPGGHSRIKKINEDIDRLHADAGIAWWLDFVKDKYGPWKPESREANSAVRNKTYTRFVRSHLDRLMRHGTDIYGPETTNMWLATIDTSTGRMPEVALPDKLRWYRKITSPRGSNLYWDGPSLLAAYEISERSGETSFAEKSNAYVDDFLDRCVAPQSGLFLWGNHVYYDVVTDKIATFSGGYHECRPHTPPWELFWSVNPKATERAVRAMGLAHVKDPSSGRFCRHANWRVAPGTFAPDEVSNAKPFLEAGAVLIDSLSWLAAKKDQRRGELADMALQVARYSYDQREPATGLLRNQPVDRRWDYYASTTEVGLWAGSLLRAADYTGNPEFSEIAQSVIRPWLHFGFDDRAGKYYGRLDVATGRPQPPEDPRGWIPPMHAEVFDMGERPTHNYPMPMAEACLSLYQTTHEPVYEIATQRWVTHIRNSLPAGDGRGAYAEDFGRTIHFLVRASQVFDRPDYEQLARKIADEAISHLYIEDEGLFRSHPGENRCDAVDGPGILLLALLFLDTGQERNSAFAF